MAQAQKRRIIFMGTPDFAAIILERLLKEPDLEIIAVFTQPDRKAGRGMKESFSEVKKFALANGLPVYQPRTLRDPDIAELIKDLRPDFILVASYGLILPPPILALARALNVHASVLPRYRGAAPIQRAMLENWRENAKTGVSIMKMEEGLDTGPVYAFSEILMAEKTHDELRHEMASLGAELLISVLADFENRVPLEQDDSKATYAPKLTREDGELDWIDPAPKLAAAVRALQPWPGAQAIFEMGGERIHVNIIKAIPAMLLAQGIPGQLRLDGDRLLAACGEGWLEIVELRPQGRKTMTGAAFAHGRRIRQGDCGVAIH